MNIAPIAQPLSGEHLAATWPTLRPEIEDSWRQRVYFWSGRSLTADALELEQEHRAGLASWLGRAFSPGVVRGLEVALEGPPPTADAPTLDGQFLHLLPGYGLTATGEDVVVPQAVRTELARLPVYYVHIPGVTEPPATPPPTAEARNELDFGGFQIERLRLPAGRIPRAAVLLLEPVELGNFEEQSPTDPCELDPTRDPFSGERRNDSLRLALCELPLALFQHPLLDPTNADAPDDPRWRNRLAQVIFATETAQTARRQLRFLAGEPLGQRWDTLNRLVTRHPWEFLGVPLGLFGTEVVPNTTPVRRRFFLDRGAVVRAGGQSLPRPRPTVRLATSEDDAALNPPGHGTPATWRARVDQFAEHLAELSEDYGNTGVVATPEQLAGHFQWLPPAGLLPRAALDIITTAEARLLPAPPAGVPRDRAATSRFFPDGFLLEAVPVCTHELDPLFARCAALDPLDLANPGAEPLQLLVPIREGAFDPEVLVVAEPDARVFQELQRLIDVRQDWLNRRGNVRRQHSLLDRSLTGHERTYPLPADDPERQDDDELRPATTPTGFGPFFRSPAVTDDVATFAIAATVEGDAGLPDLAAGLPVVAFYVDTDAVPEAIRVIWENDQGLRQAVWWGASGADPNWGTLVAQSSYLGTVPEPGVWRAFLLNRRSTFPIHPPNAPGLEAFLAESATQAFPTLRFRRVRYEVLRGRLAVGVGISLFQVATRAFQVFEAEAVAGDWLDTTDSAAEAPMEERFEPEYPDGTTLAARLAEAQAAFQRTDPPRTIAADGLTAVLDELEQEANQADDFVDLNFARAQINLYRIRKFILGENAAQKLLINPALATIAEQQTSTASSEKLAEFVSKAKGRPISAELLNTTLTRPLGNVRSGPASRAATRATKAPPLSFNAGSTAFLKPQNQRITGASAFLITQPEAEISSPIFAAPVSSGFAKLPTDGGISALLPVGDVIDAGTTGVFRRPADVVNEIITELPEVGPVLPPRGVTIGQRFVEPPATENLSHARAALNQLMQQLPRLRLRLTGEEVLSPNRVAVPLLVLQGLGTPTATQTAEQLRVAAVDTMLTATGIAANAVTDEAEVTFAALDFTEVKTAVLRAIERVVNARRLAITRGRETLQIASTTAARALARLDQLDRRIAEARHDVSVGRALWQEEVEDTAAINDRRDAVLRDEVTFLAYVRPRTFHLAQRDTPGWTLDPAEAPAPIPACLQQHDDRPDEAIESYLELFHHAPARWFVAARPLLLQLDTREQLVAVLDAARASLPRFASLEDRFARSSTVSAVQSALFSGLRSLSQIRPRAATLPLLPTHLAPWTDFLQQTATHASLGDLIEGQHSRPEIGTAAKAELDLFARVATCLHAEFAAVTPRLRLAWTQRYSQFDQPSPLRDLSVLPDFGQLDRHARRRLQTFADWLFGRIATPEADAVNLINDLIRLCLLLASHAPVNRIITGHVPRPTPVRPGIKIPLRPLDPSRIRVGMDFHVWQGAQIVARGQVEDLHTDQVLARVDQVTGTSRTLDGSMQVQFVSQALRFTKTTKTFRS